MVIKQSSSSFKDYLRRNKRKKYCLGGGKRVSSEIKFLPEANDNRYLKKSSCCTATFTSFLRKKVSTALIEGTAEFELKIQMPQLHGGS